MKPNIYNKYPRKLQQATNKGDKKEDYLTQIIKLYKKIYT